MVKRLQYAVVGCGGRGLGYVRLLAAADGAFADVDLLALCDAHEATRNNLGEECGISSEHLHETVADMLEADGDALDCVVIATPAHLNKICALPCIERGLHVMMEKPVRSPDPTPLCAVVNNSEAPPKKRTKQRHTASHRTYVKTPSSPPPPGVS